MKNALILFLAAVGLVAFLIVACPGFLIALVMGVSSLQEFSHPILMTLGVRG